jgi:hypothetical protein
MVSNAFSLLSSCTIRLCTRLWMVFIPTTVRDVLIAMMEIVVIPLRALFLLGYLSVRCGIVIDS